ncbi:hypothetical protein Pcinc_031296 [Petrolisthes cinctipes]|nr:hypothetical protein Pcinc_031296 [Petrolisthes cinctipes]
MDIKQNELDLNLRQLNVHEQNILPFLVPASVLDVKWVDVGGCCGKTLLAKAIATQVRANFLNLDISIVRNKWYGETEKYTTAIFTLASKLQPCIIFLDEVDSFLASRDVSDHSVDAHLSPSSSNNGMDSLQTPNPSVNSGRYKQNGSGRPSHSPQTATQVSHPTTRERGQITDSNIHLRTTTLANDVDLEELAHMTHGLSGSDLQEICRCASVSRVVDYMERPGSTGDLRELRMDDLKKAYVLTTTKKRLSCNMYI